MDMLAGVDCFASAGAKKSVVCPMLSDDEGPILGNDGNNKGMRIDQDDILLNKSLRSMNKKSEGGGKGRKGK